VQLRVMVRNFTQDNGNNGILVTHVSRVQFVSDGNRFYYLRLYSPRRTRLWRAPVPRMRSHLPHRHLVLKSNKFYKFIE
jgi:hypothetical protein